MQICAIVQLATAIPASSRACCIINIVSITTSKQRVACCRRFPALIIGREKKGLVQQLDKMQDVVAQLEQRHVEDLAARDLAHKIQLQEIRDQLEQRQVEWVGSNWRPDAGWLFGLHDTSTAYSELPLRHDNSSSNSNVPQHIPCQELHAGRMQQVCRLLLSGVAQ